MCSQAKAIVSSGRLPSSTTAAEALIVSRCVRRYAGVTEAVISMSDTAASISPFSSLRYR